MDNDLAGVPKRVSTGLAITLMSVVIGVSCSADTGDAPTPTTTPVPVAYEQFTREYRPLPTVVPESLDPSSSWHYRFKSGLTRYTLYDIPYPPGWRVDPYRTTPEAPPGGSAGKASISPDGNPAHGITVEERGSLADCPGWHNCSSYAAFARIGDLQDEAPGFELRSARILDIEPSPATY
ncbi:MAG: hypothetical protein ACOC5M_03005, partial [Chloroflexota bacterium]